MRKHESSTLSVRTIFLLSVNPRPRNGGALMIVVLGMIAGLILASVIILQRFMKDMAIVEKDLLKEIKEMKQCLIRINEKQL